MEAVALERPVLVTAKAGLGELARQGVAKSVSDPSDPEAVAGALARMIEMDSNRPTPASVEGAQSAPSLTAGGQRIQSWDQCAAELAEVYYASL
jgi:glycosyltransferase involved in cell wall biosynthesis